MGRKEEERERFREGGDISTSDREWKKVKKIAPFTAEGKKV